jgi:hypothetical protein
MGPPEAVGTSPVAALLRHWQLVHAIVGYFETSSRNLVSTQIFSPWLPVTD